MGIPAISSLANMEYMLYPKGLSIDASCPSYTNGYMGSSSYNSIYGMPNYNANGNNSYNTAFRGNQNYAYQNTGASASGSYAANQSFGASKADLDVLGDYYVEGLSPSESLKGAAIGGAAFGLLNNTRWIIHPINSTSAALKVKDLFKDIKIDGTVWNKLWTDPNSNRIVADFYGSVHKLEGLSPELSRLPIFKTKLNKADYDLLMNEAKSLLSSPNPDLQKVAELNEKIRIATNAKTGWIPEQWAKVKGWFGGKSTVTPVSERLKDTAGIEAAAKKALEEKGSKLTLTKALKHSCTWKSGALWMGMEFLMGLPKIISAFNHDSNTGWKQVGQTTVKGAGSAIGWAVGEGVGTWAGAALGAKIGTAISPGLGTAIGAVAGLIGGSIGMWLTGKVTKKIVGNDVADTIQAEEMKKTPEGQVQLLSLTYQMAQNDKNLDSKTARAIQNVASVYGAA